MFLYDNMIKAELQTEDGFLIVSIKQDPPLTQHVKTEPSENDTESHESHFTRPIKKEPKDNNLDSCVVCDKLFPLNGGIHDNSCWNCGELKSEDKEKAGTLKINIQTESDCDHQQSGKQQSSEKLRLRFKCNVCSKKFNGRGDLNKHIRTVHDKIRAFPCPHCPYEAGRNGHLKSHMRTVHDKIRAFPCPHCPYEAGYESHLQCQIRTVHDKVRAFPCHQCPYEATQRGHLKRHILTHTGEKNFKCNICDKKFSCNDTCKRHIRTVHGKIKALPCPQSHCPYKAGCSSDLKQHIVTHTGVNDFKCDT